MVKIFVIHGMGTHKDDWWRPIETSILKLKRYDKVWRPGKTLRSLKRDIEFVPLRYDDAIVKLQDAAEYGSDLDKIAADLKNDPDNTVDGDTIDKWVGDGKALAGEVDQFRQSQVVSDSIFDVFLVANKLTRHYLALHLLKQMLPYFTEDAELKWGVLAHSLGTGLVHDVLHILHHRLVADADDGGAGRFRANVVALIANFGQPIVGDILTTIPPLSKESVVWPSIDSARDSVCNNYIAARHMFDPLSYLSKPMPKANRWPANVTHAAFNKDRYHALNHPDLNYMPDFPKGMTTLVEKSGFSHSLVNYFADPDLYLRFFLAANNQYDILEEEKEQVKMNDALDAFMVDHDATGVNISKHMMDVFGINPPKPDSSKKWIGLASKSLDELGVFK